ncbi:hypothetical protein WICMUC_002422 [Wickerhamomyces mucosus]|uniref:Cytochrome b5 heme-binding domain-containing protein n=1 Tax=Wickerhamomyces mucosus TaxID=1378264 RepID=A0A9P8PRA3_9ASCO|nr:hypothetical protein WICMUC_002422 [Wickerhamomyces mucosus]
MSKIISYQEVQQHSTKDDLWLIIDGKVYDCTKYLDEHPGGEEVIIDCAGIDATNPFDDIGHSEDARETLKELLIGEIDVETLPKGKSISSTSSSTSNQDSNIGLIIAIILVILAIVTYYILNQ